MNLRLLGPEPSALPGCATLRNFSKLLIDMAGDDKLSVDPKIYVQTVNLGKQMVES